MGTPFFAHTKKLTIMPVEIERKYLLKNDDWRSLVTKQKKIVQGYLSDDPSRVVRVRVSGDQGIVTIKGKTEGVSRAEYEYNIPVEEALELVKMCKQHIIEKTRYIVDSNQHTWEIDVFEGKNEGLQIAEVELRDENEKVTLPDWIGEEVSNDSRYYNASLVSHPFTQWD